MSDVTVIRDEPDGSAIVLTLRVPDHIYSMHPGACTRVEIVSRTQIPAEERV